MTTRYDNRSVYVGRFDLQGEGIASIENEPRSVQFAQVPVAEHAQRHRAGDGDAGASASWEFRDGGVPEGHFEEYFFDKNGDITDTLDMLLGGSLLNLPIGQWHGLKSLESDTVLFESKDGKWSRWRMRFYLRLTPN